MMKIPLLVRSRQRLAAVKRWIKGIHWLIAVVMFVMAIIAIQRNTGWWADVIVPFLRVAFGVEWRDSTFTVLGWFVGIPTAIFVAYVANRFMTPKSPVGADQTPTGRQVDSIEPSAVNAHIAAAHGPLQTDRHPAEPRFTALGTVNPSAADLKGTARAPAQFRVVYLKTDGPLWDDRRFVLGLENYGKGDASNVYLHPMDDRVPTKATHWTSIPAGEIEPFQLEPHEYQYRWKTLFRVTWDEDIRGSQKDNLELKPVDED